MSETKATPTLVPGRECGDCAMCCKLPKIDELNKKAGDWCVHCSSKRRCDAYDTRPRQCREFFCHFMENATLGEEWRPSKSRIMLMGADGGKTLLAVVDPDRPDAWRKSPYFENLQAWSAKLRIVINVGTRQFVVHGNHVHEIGANGESHCGG
jgi:Fe-S-cluster containining protein